MNIVNINNRKIVIRNGRTIQRYWFEPKFNVFWLSKDNISNKIIHNKKIVKSTAEAVMFLAPAVNTNYQENHTKKCHICKKWTSEQNQQILALAATYQ